jgi:6-pyruvoyltetrahydropterin/6-carboxytetrahydropterin synthase
MTQRIHDMVDHGFMIYEDDRELLDLFCSEAAAGFKHIIAPFIPTAENIAKWCYNQLKDAFPHGVTIANCRIFETPNSWADYRPDE